MPPSVSAASGVLEQGGILSLSLKRGAWVEKDGVKIRRDKSRVIIGFGRDDASPQEIIIHYKDKSEKWSVPLKQREYEVQYIEGIAPKYVTPPPEVLDRIRSEGVRKKKAKMPSLRKHYLSGGFIMPLEGVITGVYGSQRFFNGEPRRPHFGIDIAAAPSSVIVAPQGGVVRLAESDMYFEGGLIFLEHGMGLTSAFLHLQKLLVRKGQRVKKGQPIAIIGSGGRSSGVHLDWRVYWNGVNIDPALLIP